MAINHILSNCTNRAADSVRADRCGNRPAWRVGSLCRSIPDAGKAGIAAAASRHTGIKGDLGIGSIWGLRSEEHTSELQSLMRISYAVFCLKKKNTKIDT